MTLIPDVPTRVGMARRAEADNKSTARCPHPRGDGPLMANAKASFLPMSPPAWGWPDAREAFHGTADDVPTRVGMARSLPSRY